MYYLSAFCPYVSHSNKLRGLYSASELYRLSERHLSEKNLVPTFADREVSPGQRGGSPTMVNLSFLDRIRYFFSQVTPNLSSQGPSQR
jgi:hypothetical protein